MRKLLEYSLFTCVVLAFITIFYWGFKEKIVCERIKVKLGPGVTVVEARRDVVEFLFGRGSLGQPQGRILFA